MTRRMVVLSCSIIWMSLLAGCEGDPGGSSRPAASSVTSPVAPAASSVAALPRPGPGSSEALSARELDPFSLPGEYHSASGPLTPSTVTLPVDETYGGNAGFAFRITQEGSGNGGWFRVRSPSSVNRMALLATHTGEGIAARAINTGTGRAFWAQIPEASNPFPALVATHVGSGEAIEAIAFGSGAAVVGRATGGGSAGRFVVDNTSSFSDALFVTTDGGANSDAIFAQSTGSGNAGEFVIDNPSSPSNALFVRTNGNDGSDAIVVQLTGLGSAGIFQIINSSNSNEAMDAITNGTGIAGRFRHFGPSGEVLWLERNVSSATTLFRVRATGTSGNFAVYEIGLDRKIRFDKTGKGFFNGGTATGGADIAEAFDVVGSPAGYAPGDVLAIAPDHRRRVEKSNEAYSTRVIGVYATNPGVVLGESIEGLSGERIPVTVTGVVPTKVTADNGSIRAGDILVGSNRAGYAMKGEPVMLQGRSLYPNGSIIGKALEPFAGPGPGTILVMVNVK